MSHRVTFSQPFGSQSDMEVSIHSESVHFNIHYRHNGKESEADISLDNNQIAVLIAALMPVVSDTVKRN